MKICPLLVSLFAFLSILSLARSDDGLASQGNQSAMKAATTNETNSAASTPSTTDKSTDTTTNKVPATTNEPSKTPIPETSKPSSTSTSDPKAPTAPQTESSSNKPAVEPTDNSPKVSDTQPPTGIKAPPGTAITPKPQDAGVSLPVVKVRPQQEDYHQQQTAN